MTLHLTQPGTFALVPVALLAAWRLERRTGTHRRRSWPRAAGLAILILALAQPEVQRPGSTATLVLADRSPAVAPGALDAALTALGLPRRGIGLLEFGALGQPSLAETLELAGRALPQGGRVLVLATDGSAAPEATRSESGRHDRVGSSSRISKGSGLSAGIDIQSGGSAAVGDSLDAARRAAERGLHLHVLPLATRTDAVAVISVLDAPTVWRRGDSIPVSVHIRANQALSGTLVLRADDRTVMQEKIALSPRPNTILARVPAEGRGPLRLQARVQVANVQSDTANDIANDTADTITFLADPPNVLVVGDSTGAVSLADVLHQRGVAATVLGPARLPSRLSALAAWDVVALVDVPAEVLGTDQMAALEAYVAELGHGLVLTGGPQSYLPGGWENTKLADLAPVRLEPPPRAQRGAVAMVLIIDQSASMGSAEGRANVTKLDLAREAAILATEALSPGDRIGVVTYDDTGRWLLPLTTVGAGRQLAEVESLLGGLATGGGTRILAGLELALPALSAAALPTRHAVLITDGRDFNPDGAAYDAAVLASRAAGVTLSTIAIGADADRDLLARLARLGRGRYHSADDPSDLPRLALEESRVVRARSEQYGNFHAQPAGGGRHPVLGDLDVGALPTLHGYLAMSPREAAETALEAPDGDPLLTTWNYGLGRVVAWTSDAGEAWATDWLSGPANAFWDRLVRYVARPPQVGRVAIDSARTGADQAVVLADIQDPAGRPLDLAKVSVVVTDTGEVYDEAYDETAQSATKDVQLISPTVNQFAPGLYAATIQLPTSTISSSYAGALTVVDDAAGRGGQEGRAAVSVPFRIAAYRPGASAMIMADGHSTDHLVALASAGAGELLTSAAGALPERDADSVPLWPWLVGLAVLVWLVDVGRQMGWGGSAGSSRGRRSPAAPKPS